MQTVYRAAPGKAGLLAAAVNAAVAGGSARAAVPVEERPAIRAVIEGPVRTHPTGHLGAGGATATSARGRRGIGA
jgi:hypothetical protein